MLQAPTRLRDALTFSLKTIWTPERDNEPAEYELILVNAGPKPIRGFKLAISGPARLDPKAAIEGGSLETRLSNHAILAPPPGFVLQPGERWHLTARGMSYPLRHWTDGTNGAYLILEDGLTLQIATSPTILAGDRKVLRQGAIRLPPPARIAPALSIIPWPNIVSVSGSRPVPQCLRLIATCKDAEKAAARFQRLTKALFPDEGLVKKDGAEAMPVTIGTIPDLPDEAYRIRFSNAGVDIAASTQIGMLYALITLGQIWRGASQHPQAFVFPAAGSIDDEPGLAWRGTHLDVARQFYPETEIARFLDILAWNKMNRLHWHLADDEGWRVEIDAYPELTRIGAWRGHDLPVPPLLGSGPAPLGGFYSKSSIRQLVAQGEDLGIKIVPEIDMPGHCYALLAAVPELRDPGEFGEYFSVQGFPNNCLNPAREELYGAIETIIDEILALFPAGIFHLGADEVPLAAWSGSPLALVLLEKRAGQAAAATHGALLEVVGNVHGADAIEGSATAILQAEFIDRIHRYIAEKGAITGGWQEAAHGDVLDKSNTYLVGWRNVEISAALAGAGYDIVVSPGQHYYLDMANDPDWSEPGASWAGCSSLEQTYTFEPRAGWTNDQLTHLLGVQSCIWSEPMTDPAVFDRLVFPRLSAVAETGWTRPQSKSWPRFSAVAGLMPILYGIWEDQHAEF